MDKEVVYIYTMKYYSVIKMHTFESVLMRWMKLEPIIHQYTILTHIYGIQKDGNDDPISKTAKETQIYRTDIWTM